MFKNIEIDDKSPKGIYDGLVYAIAKTIIEENDIINYELINSYLIDLKQDIYKNGIYLMEEV